MTSNANLASLEDFERTLWKMRNGMFWVGTGMILLGIAALTLPVLSSLVVEILIGWLLAISGLVSVIGSFGLRGTGLFIWELLAGLMTLAAGLLLLVFPLAGLVALTVVVALVLLLTGVAQGAFALWMRPARGWVWGLLSALVSVVLGGFILAAMPEASAVMLGLLVGIDFLSTGLALVLVARSAGRTLDG